ncbi:MULTISPECIES: helix-hairpin-helix domain-containing protein [Allobacillus]|uniref:Helix-hairpin-helix domain-containing protein n=1 Tax=Allobacillus halotolerans TaxID=570278 RepID=A0ABS6GP22_9BACI|nr:MULTISPECIES: helix-hairpin-helix domain-containing protein [Allobacillus]MBU6080695.1 helix-hairpin-helix domain-containing protein [Allobacillus halotolerans]TSJ68266.1 competence protein ComE [Allobacillus sp. SKP2-8]
MIIQKKWLIYVLIFLLLLIALFLFQQNPETSSIVIEEPIEAEEEVTNSIDDSIESKIIWVDIKGMVEKPGVYQLKEGDRVKDAIQVAGGFLKDADELMVNMAALIQDEMVIYVPAKGETEDANIFSTGGKVEEGKVRINSAGLDEIMTLPGIGEQKAKSIIEFRDTNGKFQSVDDLLQISGIGEKTLERFREMVIVP